MKNLIMILGMVFITGCYPATEWVVSENNDPEFIEAAKKASEAWCEADKDAKPCLPFRITDKDEEANVLYEVSEDETYFAYTWIQAFQSTKVKLRSHCPKESWAWSIAHEMGHASTHKHGHPKDGWIMLEGNIVKLKDRAKLVPSKEDIAWLNGD